MITTQGEEMSHGDQNSAQPQYLYADFDFERSVYAIARQVTVEEQRDHVEGRGESVGEGEAQTDY